VNNTLSVSSPEIFNDPFDCLLLLYFKEATKNKMEINTDNLLNACKKIKIRCFVENDGEPTNPLMWSHYADGHKGICIKYQFPNDVVSHDDDKRIVTKFQKVKYKENMTFYLEEDKISKEEALCTKTKDWEYENEIRLIHYDCSCESLHKTIPLLNNCIKAIYFGFLCPESDKKLIRRLLRGKKVAFFQMNYLKDDIFKLQTEQV